MSRRSSMNDDKLISEMILKNISIASQMNIDISDILNTQQMRLMIAYKEIYNYEPYLSFFLSLALMSHCSQGSYYNHYASPDRRPVQLYLWLLGASGCGKTHAFRQLEKAIIKTEKLFPENYLKSVIVNGKPSECDLSSIITHTNHIGLRQHLASNHKILLNDDADLIAETYGLYNVNDYSKEHERNIILCGFDGFNNSSRTTGTTLIQIDDKRLTIAIATTGGKMMKNMKNWINYTGFDGSHNRFVYMSLPKLIYSRPQDFRVNVNVKNNPSLAHLGVVVHLFGKVRYVFQMSESERKKFFGAKFSPSSTTNEDDQTQQQQSAMFTVWNIIADLAETQDQKENEQQQIIDLYAKAGAIFPRLVCLMQLYFNACAIFEHLNDSIIFSEGDNQNLIINDSFISNVKSIIQKDYYKYDLTYISSMESDLSASDPMVIVEKETVITAWKWYEHHLSIAVKLFKIDHEFSVKPIAISSSIKSQPKTLKQLIMLLDFNCFPMSAISVKHPATGQTGIIKNRPAFGEQALHELIKDNLLKFNYFLTDARGRNLKSYLKIPIPENNDPTREQFFNNLLKHDINIDEYCTNYKNSSIPLNNNFSKLALETFESTSCFVQEYSKYKNQLNYIIQKHMENHNIEETETGNFIIKNHNPFFRRFHDIENLYIGSRQEKINNRSQSINLINQTTTNQTTKSIIQLKNKITTDVDTISNTVEKNCEIEHHNATEILQHLEDVDTTITRIQEEHGLSRDIDNFSGTIFERPDADDETSDISTQQTIKEITNINKNETGTMIKRAMLNIMNSRSVIYTKTDLTKICNKSSVRLEAVKCLVDAGLLQYGDNYWIEPNRGKKNAEKDCKRILREGWLKKGPDSDSNASKFKFIQILQENINLTYDDYLKTFYPQQDENVNTHNNWFLSDEVIHIFNSHFFYKKHVRWNIERFQFAEFTRDKINMENEGEIPLIQVQYLNSSNKRTTNENSEEICQQQSIINNDKEGETVLSTCIRSKRKAEMNENLQEHQTRTQPSRMKKKIN